MNTELKPSSTISGTTYRESSVRAVVFNQDVFCPNRYLAMTGDRFGYHNWALPTCFQWVEPINVAEHPTMTGQDSTHSKESFSPLYQQY